MSAILPSQRALFELDPGVVYLDSASLGPLPRRAAEVAREAATAKARPWTRDRQLAQAQAGRLRELAAGVVDALPGDLAIVCAASYGLAVAARNLPVRPGQRVLVLQDDHASQALTWQAHAERCGATLEVVPRPADGDWTGALLAHLERAEARSIALASLSASFWLDGARIGLRPVCRRLRALGARIVLDLTQSAGVLDADLQQLDPDFAVFSAYKWLLGPYALAFLYVAPRWQQGEPLEQNGFNRDASGALAAGARRFDMGQRDTFVGIPTAIASLELLRSWDRAALQARLAHLSARLAQRLAAHGLDCVPPAHRSPHILGVRGVPHGVAAACQARGIHFTQRGDGLRFGLHAFNTEADVDAAGAAVCALVPRRAPKT